MFLFFLSSSHPLHCAHVCLVIRLFYFQRRMKHGAQCCPRHSWAPYWCSLRQTPSSAAVFTMPLTNSPAANGRTPHPFPTLCFSLRRPLSWLPCLLSPWRCKPLPSTFGKPVQRTHRRRRLWLRPQQRLQLALLLVQAVLALQCHCRSEKRRCQRWRRSRATRGHSTT